MMSRDVGGSEYDALFQRIRDELSARPRTYRVDMILERETGIHEQAEQLYTGCLGKGLIVKNKYRQEIEQATDKWVGFLIRTGLNEGISENVMVKELFTRPKMDISSPTPYREASSGKGVLGFLRKK